MEVRLVLANGAVYVETVNAGTKYQAVAGLAKSLGYGRSDIYAASVNGERIDRTMIPA